MPGTNRSDIKRGLEVDIVLKADQPTGKLTRGVVQDILTSSGTHHRGIKVRLTSGQVGRVQNIINANLKKTVMQNMPKVLIKTRPIIKKNPEPLPKVEATPKVESVKPNPTAVKAEERREAQEENGIRRTGRSRSRGRCRAAIRCRRQHTIAIRAANLPASGQANVPSGSIRRCRRAVRSDSVPGSFPGAMIPNDREPSPPGVIQRIARRCRVGAIGG
jgi:uncharacterized repeat protein (TIGR03833 family)